MAHTLTKTTLQIANAALGAYSDNGVLRYQASVNDYDQYGTSQPIPANSSVQFLTHLHNNQPINCLAMFPDGDTVTGTLTFELYDALGTQVFWKLPYTMSGTGFGNMCEVKFPFMIIETGRRVKITTTRNLAGLYLYCLPVGDLGKYGTI